MSAPDRQPLFERLCPDCGDKLHAKAIGCGCGWSQAPRDRSSRQQQTVQFDQSCVWNDRGRTCGASGVCSDTTNGAGSWYCRTHWARLKGWPETSVEDTVTYRERWYLDHKLPYEPPKLGDMPPFRCVGRIDAAPTQQPVKRIERVPGEDTPEEVYGEETV